MSLSRPNIVLVTADSLRADHCGFLNPAAETTPTLDTLANDGGLVFTDAVSPGPRTPSSIPEIMTGEQMRPPSSPLPDFETRINNVRSHVERHSTIAQRFAERGYTTLGFTTNPWTTTHSGFDVGFDLYKQVDSPDEHHRLRTLSEGVLGDGKMGTWVTLLDDWWNGYGMFSRWASFVDDIVREMQRADQPYFLWVFLVDTHNPYLAPRKYREDGTTLGTYYSLLKANEAVVESDSMSNLQKELPTNVQQGLKRAYADCVRSVDGFVQQLATHFDQNTVFAFHSDHGEAFGGHGTFGHQRVLYEENIRIPLLMYSPRSDWVTNDTVHRQTSLRNLPDMLLSVAEDPTTVDTAAGKYSLLSTEDGLSFAIRSRDWKYINTEEDEELYHLTNDSQERNNLLADHNERYLARRDMLREAAVFQNSPLSGELDRSDAKEPESETVPSDVGERLSALGYTE